MKILKENSILRTLNEELDDSTKEEFASYLYNESDGEVDEIPSYEETNDYIVAMDKKEYKVVSAMVKEAIENVADHFYNGRIELSDRATLNNLRGNFDEADADQVQMEYGNLVEQGFKQFQEETGVEAWQDGRMGRHIVVEDTFYNAYHYDELCEAQEKWENWVIDEMEKRYPENGLTEAIVMSRLIDNDMTVKELDDTANWLYKYERDEWDKFTDAELIELAKLCQITDKNPGGRAYDDEVFDEMDRRGLKLSDKDRQDALEGIKEAAEPKVRVACKIDWETDGDKEALKSLPKYVELPDDISEDEVADYLSDQYGWLVNSVDVKYITKDTDINKLKESSDESKEDPRRKKLAIALDLEDDKDYMVRYTLTCKECNKSDVFEDMFTGALIKDIVKKLTENGEADPYELNNIFDCEIYSHCDWCGSEDTRITDLEVFIKDNGWIDYDGSELYTEELDEEVTISGTETVNNENGTPKKVKDYLDYELEDDNTATGGTSFAGEKVRDFIGDTDIKDDDDIDTLNKALVSCGIKPITESEKYDDAYRGDDYWELSDAYTSGNIDKDELYASLKDMYSHLSTAKKAYEEITGARDIPKTPDTDIVEITISQVDELINDWDKDPSKVDKGRYLAKDKDNRYVAIDNRSGECFVEEFDTREAAMDYLNDKELKESVGRPNVDIMCKFIGDLFNNMAEGFTANSESLYDWCEGGDTFRNAGYNEEDCKNLDQMLTEINPLIQAVNGKLFEFAGEELTEDVEIKPGNTEANFTFDKNNIMSDFDPGFTPKLTEKDKKKTLKTLNNIKNEKSGFSGDFEEILWHGGRYFTEEESKKFRDYLNTIAEKICAEKGENYVLTAFDILPTVIKWVKGIKPIDEKLTEGTGKNEDIKMLCSQVDNIGDIVGALNDAKDNAKVSYMGEDEVGLVYDDDEDIAYIDNLDWLKDDLDIENKEDKFITDKLGTVRELKDALKLVPESTFINPFGESRCGIAYDSKNNIVYIDEKDTLKYDIMEEE